jgi:hypothetical protein
LVQSAGVLEEHTGDSCSSRKSCMRITRIRSTPLTIYTCQELLQHWTSLYAQLARSQEVADKRGPGFTGEKVARGGPASSSRAEVALVK